ncbi:hypothetical protein ACFPN0_21300 [Kitasatospora cinereorecta]
MSSYPRTVLCPVAETAAPGSGLPRAAVSLTLPGARRSSAIARGAVTAALRAHGLTAYLWPAVLVAAELVAVTVSLTPGRDLYLSLRHRDDVLRLLVWDQHPHHRPRPPKPRARGAVAGPSGWLRQWWTTGAGSGAPARRPHRSAEPSPG